MSEAFDTRISKLPKWAWEYITQQDRTIAQLECELAQITSADGDVLMNVGPGHHDRDEVIRVTRESRYGLQGVTLQAHNRLHLSMDNSNTVWMTPHSLRRKEN